MLKMVYIKIHDYLPNTRKIVKQKGSRGTNETQGIKMLTKN